MTAPSMRARAPSQSGWDGLDGLAGKGIRFANSHAKCKKMMVNVALGRVGWGFGEGDEGVVFGDGVEGEDVADEVFEHLVVFDEAGGEDHFGAVDIAFGRAAVTGFEFGELGGEVPALEAVEGWAAEGEFAAGVVAVAFHAAHFEEVSAFFDVCALDRENVGNDERHRFNMGGDAFDLGGLEGFGDGGHHGALRI